MTTPRSELHVRPGDPDAILQHGFWVPNRVWATATYLLPLRQAMDEKRDALGEIELAPAIRDLADWLAEPENRLYDQLWHQMIRESNRFVLGHQDDVQAIQEDGDWVQTVRPKDGPYEWVRNSDELLELLSEIITTSPGFNDTEMVGTPMNGLFAVAMGTPAGFALFSAPAFNAQMRKVLDSWNHFLKKKESLDKLDIDEPEKPGSWISQAAYAAGVWQEMQFDPKKPGYGFDSWNDFFIREFVPGARPFQGDPDQVIAIGCETTPWQYEDDLRFDTSFDIKHGKYSLIDIFEQDAEIAGLFLGGQAYQGFLSATHYHRWQAPLRGKLVRSWRAQGTYFAQNPSQGEDAGTWEGTESQPYLPQVATRAIFVFEHETFGYVALICVGMVEVSTCLIYEDYLVPREGHDGPVSVEPGDEIGRFEFGGSTHMMIFQKGKADLVSWAKNARKFRDDATPQPLGSIIALAPKHRKPAI